MFSLWLFKNYQYLWVSESKFKVPNKLIFLWSWSPDLKKLNCKWDVFMLVCKVVSLALTMMKYQLSYLVYHIMPYTMKPLVLTSLYSMVSLYHTSRSCWQSCHIIWSSLYNLYISMWWEIQHSFQRWSCYAVLFKAPEQFKIVVHGQKSSLFLESQVCFEQHTTCCFLSWTHKNNLVEGKSIFFSCCMVLFLHQTGL